MSPSLYKIYDRLGKSNDSEITTAALAAFKLFFIPLGTATDKKATKEQKEYAIARDVLTELIALGGYIGITNVFKNNVAAPLSVANYKKKAKLIEKGKIADLANTISKDDLDILKKVDGKALKAVAVDTLNGTNKATAEQIKHVNILENVCKKVEKLIPQQTDLKGLDAFKNGAKKLFTATKEIQMPKDLYTNSKVSASALCVYVLALTFIPMMCNVIITPIMAQYRKMKGMAAPTQGKKLDINPVEKQQPVSVANPVANVNSKKDVSFGNNYQATALGNMRVGR